MIKTIIQEYFIVSLTTSIVILGLLALSPLLKKYLTPKWRYWIWAVLAVRLLIPFNISLEETPVTLETSTTPVYTAAPTNPAPIQAPSQSQGNSQTAKMTPGEIAALEKESQAFSLSFLDIAATIWIGGAGVYLVLQFAAYFRFLRLCRRWRRPIASEAINTMVDQLCVEMEIRRPVEAISCKAVPGPMMTGLFRPKILLPHEDYGTEELLFILTHELVHYKRHDIWYKFLLILANGLHWFNPFVYLMNREANRDLEITCDSEVVKNMDAEYRGRYSETILSAIRHGQRYSPAFTTYFNGGKSSMKQRLQNLFDFRKKRKGYALLCIAILAVGLVGGLVACNETDKNKEQVFQVLDRYLETTDYSDRIPVMYYDLYEEQEDGIQTRLNGFVESLDLCLLDPRIAFRDPDQLTDFDKYFYFTWMTTYATMVFDESGEIQAQIDSWYDEAEEMYHVPVSDIRQWLDDYLGTTNFDPEKAFHPEYFSESVGDPHYDPETDILTIEHLVDGFGGYRESGLLEFEEVAEGYYAMVVGFYTSGEAYADDPVYNLGLTYTIGLQELEDGKIRILRSIITLYELDGTTEVHDSPIYYVMPPSVNDVLGVSQAVEGYYSEEEALEIANDLLSTWRFSGEDLFIGYLPLAEDTSLYMEEVYAPIDRESYPLTEDIGTEESLRRFTASIFEEDVADRLLATVLEGETPYLKEFNGELYINTQQPQPYASWMDASWLFTDEIITVNTEDHIAVERKVEYQSDPDDPYYYTAREELHIVRGEDGVWRMTESYFLPDGLSTAVRWASDETVRWDYTAGEFVYLEDVEWIPLP